MDEIEERKTIKVNNVHSIMRDRKATLDDELRLFAKKYENVDMDKIIPNPAVCKEIIEEMNIHTKKDPFCQVVIQKKGCKCCVIF